VATFYVDFTNGNDLSNGLGPDASAATNKPWKTLVKVFHTGSTVVPGDTVYFAPGRHYTAALTPIAGIASAASPTAFRGDPFNTQGFKTSGGVRVVPGMVRWDSGRTAAGQEDVAALFNKLIDFGTNGISGVAFYDLCLEAGEVIGLSLANCDNVTFEDCLIIGNNSSGVAVGGTPTAGRVWRFRRCEFRAPSFFFANVGISAATAGADLDILFESCRIHGRAYFNLGTSAGNKSGGIYFVDSDVFTEASGSCFQCIANTLSVALATGDRLGIHIRGSRFIGSGLAISGGTLGQVWDDGYNRFLYCGGNSNFTQDATTVRNPQINLVFDSLAKWGYPPEYVGRYSMGWAAEASASQKFNGVYTSTVEDFYHTGLARPWGGGPALGAVEVADFSRDTTSLIDGVDSLKIAGSGDIDFLVPVDAVATTVSVKARQDASYGAGVKPQLLILAEPDLGVAAQTITGIAAADTVETLTSASFTPSAPGVVTVRLRAQAAPIGACHFDTIARS